MNFQQVTSIGRLLLVGGGACHEERLRTGLAGADRVVAADGGADRVLALGRVPDAVIGDLDSISSDARARIPSDRVHRIADQESTDFDKALRSVSAPLIEAHGMLGARLDHSLAALTVLARRANRRCLLIGREDAVALVPPVLAVTLAAGDRVSLWPLAPVSGRSIGLRWPIDGLHLAPDGAIGTSNEATGPVRIETDAPKLLILLPVAAADALCDALLEVPPWGAEEARA